jgi:DNA-binding response OmpR family regulator
VTDNKILVITRDPLIKEAARFAFPPDIEIVSAQDAREAHRICKEGLEPDAVIIDIHTGSAGGFAAASDLAEDPRVTQAPILMLLEREQDVWLARQAGARTVRVKPIEASDLVADVLSLLESNPSPAV